MMDSPGKDKLLTEQLKTVVYTGSPDGLELFLMYSSICMLPNICEKLTKYFLSQKLTLHQRMGITFSHKVFGVTADGKQHQARV